MSLWSCGEEIGSGVVGGNQQQQQQKQIVPIAALQHDKESLGRVYKSITCSSTASFLVDNRGLVYAMGSGFLGVKSSSSQVTVPKQLSLFTGESAETSCRAVFSNTHRDKNFTFFLADNGALYSLGNSSDFRTGVGTEIDLESIRMMGGFDSGVEMVAVGVSHGIAITSTFSFYVWGRPLGFGGQVYPTPTKVDLVGCPNHQQDPVVQMVAGEGYTLLLTKDGKLFGFGDYASTCLGPNKATNETDNEKIDSKKIELVELDWGFGPLKQVACGYNHALALTADGRVLSWGSNKNGALGINQSQYDYMQVTPTYINNLPKVIYLHANHFQSFVITVNGDVYSWGYNVKGSLGTKFVMNYVEPERVYQLSPSETNGLKINQIANDEGRIPTPQGTIEIHGDKSKAYPDLPDSFVNSSSDAEQVASAQLWSSGSIFATDNEPDDRMTVFRPTKSTQGKGRPSCMAVGNRCSYVSFQDGSIFDWGSGFALGHGVDGACREPSRIYDLDHVKVVQIVASPEEDVCVVLTENGKVYGWGRATNHLNGTGSESDVHHPRLLEGFRSQVVKVSMSQTHCLAVDDGGNIYAWGSGKALGNRNRSSSEKGPKKIQDQTFFAIDVAADIQAHENFMKGLTDEVKFWTLVDSDKDIDTWCGRVNEVKDFLNRPESYHYSPNVAQSIQHSQKNIPGGERVIKGWVMYSINFKDYESDRIVLVTTEAIHRVKYDWVNLAVIHDKKFPLSSIYKVKVGRFTDWKSSISSSLRSKVYDQQVGIQIWFENPATYKPPSFIQPFAKNNNVPYITLRPALSLNSTNIEEQLNICYEIGTAIQCAVHSQRNANRPIELLHKFSRESPANNKDLAAFPVRKADIQRYHGNGLLSFAHNKYLKKTQKGFIDPRVVESVDDGDDDGMVSLSF
ncbi:ankyrin repeat-containing protein [Cavenderia fasciculata]|uniref:Ankyrin repeat-containing protein n=1 Tax=Cavenderia fasciculata TaxID=261658 RepID=F4PMW7_CACFS|nr:ankyrin repeat-containing protein [Cavenderia fasciculata]EGG23711.1 ankyrin repeat-containing protein [Cavenderia fasciculata]|eukprot:XP_004361562.1 ankyrin repeat-containing protein [Cavenderia fasciculata]